MQDKYSKKYAVLNVSPDGEDYQVDYFGDTVQEAWNAHGDGGSRWYFYPMPFVIRNPYKGGNSYNTKSLMRQRIIDVPYTEMPVPWIIGEELKGKTVKTALRKTKIYYLMQQDADKGFFNGFDVLWDEAGNGHYVLLYDEGEELPRAGMTYDYVAKIMQEYPSYKALCAERSQALKAVRNQA